MFIPNAPNTKFGRQDPRYFGRLTGSLSLSGGAPVVPMDPFDPTIIGAVPPGLTPNAPWTWDSQGTASVVQNADNTFTWSHDGFETPVGSRAIFYVAPDSPTAKIRIEMSAAYLVSAAPVTDPQKFGLAVGSDSGDALTFAYQMGPGFIETEDLVLLYRPTDGTTVGEVIHGTQRAGSIVQLSTLIMEYNPFDGGVDCKLSLNLGSSTMEIDIFPGETQTLAGTFDKIGIYSSASQGHGVWANVLHFDWFTV